MLNDLLLRAREYVYDREGFEPFVDELFTVPADERAAVADYLAGHGLAIGRWVTVTRGKSEPGPWFWLDRLYLPAIALTFKPTRTLEVVGHQEPLRSADELPSLKITP